MRPDPGPIPLADLRADGVLLEINRRVLHPVGLQLTVTDGLFSIKRDEPTGRGGCDFDVGFLIQTAAEPKCARFRALESTEHPARFRTHGFYVQPLPGEPPRVVAALDSDCAGIWKFIQETAAPVAADIAGALAANFDPSDMAADLAVAMARIIAPLLSRLELHSFDGGATWAWHLGAAPVVDETMDPAERCRYLIAEIRRLQNGGAAALADMPDQLREYAERAKGELYPDEWAEFEQAAVRFDQLQGATVNESTAAEFSGRIDAIRDTLETLYASAQPGMRLWRGDEDRRQAFEASRETLRDAARSAVTRMSERERLESGELHDAESADWPGIEAHYAAQLAQDTAECAEAERAMNAAIQKRETAQRCLTVARRALNRDTATGNRPAFEGEF